MSPPALALVRNSNGQISKGSRSLNVSGAGGVRAKFQRKAEARILKGPHKWTVADFDALALACKNACIESPSPDPELRRLFFANFMPAITQIDVTSSEAMREAALGSTDSWDRFAEDFGPRIGEAGDSTGQGDTSLAAGAIDVTPVRVP